MIHPSPLVEVRSGGRPFATTENGVDLRPGEPVTIRLIEKAGVDTWTLDVIGYDELLRSPRLVVNAAQKEATLTAPPPGSAMIVLSTVNGAKDAFGVFDPTLMATFGLFTRTVTGYRVGALNETTEGNALFGWLDKLNALLRSGASFPLLLIHEGSANIAVGDAVCVTVGGSITKATPAALDAAGTVVGLALAPGTGGERILVVDNGVVDPFVAGLGPGAVGPVRVNPATARPERVASFGVGDVPLGFANAEGYLTLVRGVVVGRVPSGPALGDLGGTFPAPAVERLRGAALPAGTALTPGHVLQVTGPETLGYGPIDLGAATGSVDAGRLPLDVPGGVPSLDGQTKLAMVRLLTNQALGVAALDGTARLAAERLPRRRDDPATVALRWRLDESQGPFAASGSLAGAGAALAVTGAHTPNARGFFRRALRFSQGQYAYASGGASQKVGGSALTVSLWALVPAPTAASNPYFLAGRSYRAGSTWTSPFVTWSLSGFSDGTLRAQITTGASGAGTLVDLVSDYRLPALAQTFLAFTYNGSNFTLYVNGLAIATRSATGPLDYNDASTGPYFVGAPPVPANVSNAFPIGATFEDVMVETVAQSEETLRARYLRAHGLFEDAA